MSTLPQLHDEIETRVASIRAQHPDWRCGKGCDGCCRHLAEVPTLTKVEWEWLQQGLVMLSGGQLATIRQRLSALAAQPARPVVCPLLDQSTGACPVYRHRPVACRSYGFYAQRDKGLYCSEIEAQVAAGSLADVVWGNHDAIDRQLATQGETRSIIAWFADWAGAEKVALG